VPSIEDAYNRLHITPKERSEFRTFVKHLRLRGDDQGQATRLAFHALDRCNKRIAAALAVTEKAISNSVRRGRKRHRVAGKCAFARLVVVRPAKTVEYRRPEPARRPVERVNARA